MRQQLLIAPVLAFIAGCSAVSAQMPGGQKKLPADHGAAIGRLSFITGRQKIAVDKFEMTAVQIPSGDKTRIEFTPDGAPEDGGSFFVSLPGGQYRLTKWRATASDRQWEGEDIGLAIEVVTGQVGCVGSLFVKPTERQRFTLTEDGPADTIVRDECPALTEQLRQRSPALARSPVVRIARRVVSRRGS
jgi:hypothetical protein